MRGRCSARPVVFGCSGPGTRAARAVAKVGWGRRRVSYTCLAPEHHVLVVRRPLGAHVPSAGAAGALLGGGGMLLRSPGVGSWVSLPSACSRQPCWHGSVGRRIHGGLPCRPWVAAGRALHRLRLRARRLHRDVSGWWQLALNLGVTRHAGEQDLLLTASRPCWACWLAFLTEFTSGCCSCVSSSSDSDTSPHARIDNDGLCAACAWRCVQS